MGYQPNLEREEYTPPDKKRVSLVLILGGLAVLVVGLILYGLFVLAKGMIVVPSDACSRACAADFCGATRANPHPPLRSCKG